MQIVVELPDDLTQHADPAREALEAIAIAGYRAESLSQAQAGQLLGLSRLAFEGFLKDRNINDHAYSAEDLDQDIATMRQLQAAGLLQK